MARAKRYMLDTPADKQSHYYRAHKSLGLCARCSNPPVAGKSCCQTCLDKMSAGKQQAREQGMCLDCWKEPVLAGKRYCATHEAERQQRRSRRYSIRLVRRQCTLCGKQRARPGRVTCLRCSSVKNSLYISKKPSGPCS